MKAAGDAAATRRIGLSAGGRKRHYFLHLPPNLDDPTPLVIEIHGLGIDRLTFDRVDGAATPGPGRDKPACPALRPHDPIVRRERGDLDVLRAASTYARALTEPYS
jgi:hypothetical protein